MKVVRTVILNPEEINTLQAAKLLCDTIKANLDEGPMREAAGEVEYYLSQLLAKA